MTHEEFRMKMLAKANAENFGKNFIDWCISIQREFGYTSDHVLEMSWFRFKKMQRFLLNEQNEMERRMKKGH